MPLTRKAYDLIGERLKPRRKDLGRVFRDLVGAQLWAIDERLRADVDQMAPFAALRPLPDADRVICRARCCWLIADHVQIRGSVQLPATWILPATLRALEDFDGRVERCPRPETETKLLLSLVEYYAATVVTERLAPAISRWIDGTTADMLDAFGLPKAEFTAVRNLVAGVAHKELVDQLTAIAQLGAAPVEIRRQPFRAFH